MLRSDFDEECQRVITYYGEENFTRAHFVEVLRSFNAIPIERFRAMVDIIFEKCKFPPRLADFFEAAEISKQRGHLNAAYAPMLPSPEDFDGPFFPTQDWIESNMHLAKEGNPKADPEYVKTFMLKLVNVMKFNHESHKKLFGRR